MAEAKAPAERRDRAAKNAKLKSGAHCKAMPDGKDTGRVSMGVGGLLQHAPSDSKTSVFTGMPALLARSTGGFGLQTAPVALLREAFARWPPGSSPPRCSALR
jgi:hypothetical protein